MAAFSDYLENKIIDHMLRAQAYTPAANVYVALFTANTNLESNAPTSEVSGGAYARKEVFFTAASAGASANNADITWTEASANWGTITDLAVVDHVSGTVWGTNVNVLYHGALTASKTVNSGDTFKIPSGDLDVSNA